MLAAVLLGNIKMDIIRPAIKPVRFLGDSLKRLRSFPHGVRYDVGYQKGADEGQSMTDRRTFASVWDAVASSPGEAANLRLRADLMQKISAIVARKGWTQAVAAQRCGISQPRMNDLLRGRISKFSLDALVNAATALGCRVRVELKAA